MADQKKMKSETFHSDPGPMDQDENSESNNSSYELRAESPAQIRKKDETQCECIRVSLKELPSSQYRENLSASPRHSSSNIDNQSEPPRPRFLPASMIQEVT